MYFVVMPNRNRSEHLGMFCIVMPSIFIDCPAVICLPNIASYLRETALVICGPRSYLLHTVYNTCCNTLFTVPCNSYCFPHCAIISLFCKTGEIDNLSVSSWAKFWFGWQRAGASSGIGDSAARRRPPASAGNSGENGFFWIFYF